MARKVCKLVIFKGRGCGVEFLQFSDVGIFGGGGGGQCLRFQLIGYQKKDVL